MPARRCPHCGLVNPAKTMLCDCGYSFVYEEPPRSSAGVPKPESPFGSFFASRAGVRIIFGLFILAGFAMIRVCG